MKGPLLAALVSRHKYAKSGSTRDILSRYELPLKVQSSHCVDIFPSAVREFSLHL
jgi:hypothetical protein